MAGEAQLLGYQSHEILYRTAWARKRRRKTLRLGGLALFLPVASFPLGWFLAAFSRPADIGDVVVAWILALCLSAATGLIMAISAWAQARDKRVGTLPNVLAGSAMIINGVLLILLLAILMLGILRGLRI